MSRANDSRILARAPSNIALIKYMGKSDAALNLPENGSLSMTLDSLCTYVEIERAGSRVAFRAEAPDLSAVHAVDSSARGHLPASLRVPRLSDAGRAKVIRHVERTQAAVREIFSSLGLRVRASDGLVLKSANTFPEASGIASSASSFAAITLAVAAACAEDREAFERALADAKGVSGSSHGPLSLRRALARVSRQGSGSSCRSFEGPWVEWQGADAYAVESRMPELAHFVVLVSESAKDVSSSEAHLRVKTSPLWQGRRERVAHRLGLVREAIAAGDFAAVALHAWSESWEMHSLFHTAQPPFSYWKPASIDALHFFAPFVAESVQSGDSIASAALPPIVTMDAGPNVHVIVPASERDVWRARLAARFSSEALLEDKPGSGAVLLSTGRM